MSFGKFTQKEILDLVSASWAPYWGTGGGGGQNPGGPTGSIQFNSASVFSGSSNFTYNFSDQLFFTGTFHVSGAISSSLGFYGTSSWAVSASRAITASYITGSIFTSTNPVLSASYALTSSFSISSSFASTASYISSTSALPPGTYNITASWANNALTASWITSSNVYGPYGSNSILSASYAITASYALNGAGGDNIWVRSTGDNSAVLDDLSGRISSAQGSSSIAYGYTNTASGDFSQAQGYNTIAAGKTAHSEGGNNIAKGITSHVEGIDNIAGHKQLRKTYNINDQQVITIPSGSIPSGSFVYEKAEDLLGTAVITADRILSPFLSIDDSNSSLNNLVFVVVGPNGKVSGSGGESVSTYASESLAVYDGISRQLVAHVDLTPWWDSSLTKAHISSSFRSYREGDSNRIVIDYMWYNNIQDRVYVLYGNGSGNTIGYGAEQAVLWISGSYDGINPPSIYIHNTSSFSRAFNSVYYWTGSVASPTAWTSSAPSQQYLNGILREYSPWPGFLGAVFTDDAFGAYPVFNKYNGKLYHVGGTGFNPNLGVAIINSDFQLEYTGSAGTTADYFIQGKANTAGYRAPISGANVWGGNGGQFLNVPAIDSQGNVWVPTLHWTYNTPFPGRKPAGNPIDLFCLHATGSVSSSNDQLFKHTINYLDLGTDIGHSAGPFYYPGDGTPDSERIIVVVMITGSNAIYGSDINVLYPWFGPISGSNRFHERWIAYDLNGNVRENPWNQFKWGNGGQYGNGTPGNQDEYGTYYWRYSSIREKSFIWWEREKVFITRFNQGRRNAGGEGYDGYYLGDFTFVTPQGAIVDGLRYEKLRNNTDIYWPQQYESAQIHALQTVNNGKSLIFNTYRATGFPYGGTNHRFGYSQSLAWFDITTSSYTNTTYSTSDYGAYAHAEGQSNIALGLASHVEGYLNIASGTYAHAEGHQTRAVGEASHTEGLLTFTSGAYSHAEGRETTARGISSHAEGVFSTAIAKYSHAEGYQTTTTGLYSHAEGYAATAIGQSAHAEGIYTNAVGSYSHAEGYGIYVDGQFAHAEGIYTRAMGDGAHAEGETNSYSTYYAQGRASHIEGYNTKTTTAGIYGHAEGELTTTSGRGAHAEGYGGTAAASHSHAEGFSTNVTAGGVAGHAEGNQTYVQAPWAHAEGFSANAQSTASHAEGYQTETKVGSDYSHAEGYLTDTYALYSHTEGEETKTYGTSSHAEGYQTETYGYASHAEGYQAKSYGDYSHVEGYQTKTSGSYSHAEGYQSIASASYSHAEGQSITRADASHAEGYLTTTYGIFSHTEGQETSTSGSYSHAEGYGTKTTGSWSHAEGQTTIASGSYSHAEGINSIAIGQNSHAEGNDTRAYGDNSHAEGYQAKSYGASSHAEGFGSNAIGSYSHAEGINTNAVGLYSHAEGINTKASASYSHAEGYQSIAGQVGTVYVPESPEVISTSSYVDSTITIVQDTFYLANNANIVQTTDITWYFVWINSYNQGTPGTMQVIVNGTDPQETYTVYDVYFDGTYYNLISITGLTNTGFTSATISNTYTPGYSLDYWAAYAPGFSYDTLRGQGSHAEGINTIAEGDFSHAEGYYTRTIGDYSHASGIGTIASGSNGQTVIGRYNLKNNTSDLFTIGDGTDDNNRHDLVNAGIGYVNITGSLGLSGSLNFTGNMLISGSLTVIGVNITSGSVNITGSFTSNGNNTLLGTTLISGSQYIVGPTNITGSLIVSNSFSVIGNSNFTGVSSYTGSVTISSSLNVIGISIVTGSSIISGSQTIIGTEQITGSLIVSNSFTVIGTNITSGSVYITGSSTLIGDSTITGSILMTGSAAISKVNYIDFTTLTATQVPAHLEGRVHWSDDTKTLQIDTDVNNFMHEIGHQTLVRVVNKTGFDLISGSVVYISGSQGQRPAVVTASWTGDATSAATIGFVAKTINDNNNGYVVTNGILRNVNTFGYTVGTQLYLSSSGQFTDTPPDAPLHEVRLGKVIQSGTTDGIIYVDVMNGYELTELHDVKTTTYTDGDLLIQSNSLWINTKQLTGSYGLTGSLSFTNGGVTGSVFGTASWSTNALTASYVNTLYQDVVVVGNITAQQYIVSSSVIYVTQSNYSGSNTFGNTLDDTHQFTGSIYYTGSITGIGRAIFNDLSATGSLSGSFFGIASGSILNGISFLGTASWAASASVAISSSYALSSSYAESASYALSSSYAVSSSYSISSSYSVSSSYSFSSSYALSSSYAFSSSYTVTASYAESSSYSTTASYAISSSWTQPGGPYASIQFNDSNTLSGSADFLFIKNPSTVTLNGSLFVTGSTILSGTLQVISNNINQLQPAMQVNTEGVFAIGSHSIAPNPVAGGMYFDGTDFWLGYS